MKKILFFISAITLFFVACSQREFGRTTKIILKFDGLTDDFSDSFNLIREIRDSTSYTNLIRSIDNSERSIFDCPSHRKVGWRIQIYAVNEFGGKRQLCYIICTTENEIGLWSSLSEGCYKNDFLIKHIIEMVKVEEIRKFNGKMTQKDYYKLFEANSSKYK